MTWHERDGFAGRVEESVIYGPRRGTENVELPLVWRIVTCDVLRQPGNRECGTSWAVGCRTENDQARGRDVWSGLTRDGWDLSYGRCPSPEHGPFVLDDDSTLV